MTRFLKGRGKNTPIEVASRLVALEAHHVGLERGPVTDDDLFALRDALAFCREESDLVRDARAYPQLCKVQPEAAPACVGRVAG